MKTEPKVFDGVMAINLETVANFLTQIDWLGDYGTDVAANHVRVAERIGKLVAIGNALADELRAGGLLVDVGSDGNVFIKNPADLTARETERCKDRAFMRGDQWDLEDYSRMLPKSAPKVK